MSAWCSDSVRRSRWLNRSRLRSVVRDARPRPGVLPAVAGRARRGPRSWARCGSIGWTSGVIKVGSLSRGTGRSSLS